MIKQQKLSTAGGFLGRENLNESLRLREMTGKDNCRHEAKIIDVIHFEPYPILPMMSWIDPSSHPKYKKEILFL